MNLNRNWELRVRNSVYKEISKFPVKDKERIIAVIETLTFNPFAGDIEKMKDEENIWRQRVGNYRIFYEIVLNEKVIYVFRVKRRTSKTY